jgi:hypothetical protein
MNLRMSQGFAQAGRRISVKKWRIDALEKELSGLIFDGPAGNIFFAKVAERFKQLG